MLSPPCSTLFPYTTLFRSRQGREGGLVGLIHDQQVAAGRGAHRQRGHGAHHDVSGRSLERPGPGGVDRRGRGALHPVEGQNHRGVLLRVRETFGDGGGRGALWIAANTDLTITIAAPTRAAATRVVLPDPGGESMMVTRL